MTEAFTSVAIIGGGFMGAGIAEAAAVSGIRVVVRELPQFLEATRRRLETSLGRAVVKGKLDAAQRDEALARITLTSDLNDLAGVDLVIEAVSENIEIKTAIMKELDGSSARKPSSHRTRRPSPSRNSRAWSATPSESWDCISSPRCRS